MLLAMLRDQHGCLPGHYSLSTHELPTMHPQLLRNHRSSPLNPTFTSPSTVEPISVRQRDRSTVRRNALSSAIDYIVFPSRQWREYGSSPGRCCSAAALLFTECSRAPRLPIS